MCSEKHHIYCYNGGGCNNALQGVPLLLVARETGDKVKRWVVTEVRGLLAVESLSVWAECRVWRAALSTL